VVTIAGLTSCSQSTIEGWHFIGADAPTFTDGQGCNFRLVQSTVATGQKVSIQATTTACNAAVANVQVRRVSCYYAFDPNTIVNIQILDTDTCPSTPPAGGGTFLAYINQGYTQPVLQPT
jgi:hypothetical protein